MYNGIALALGSCIFSAHCITKVATARSRSASGLAHAFGVFMVATSKVAWPLVWEQKEVQFRYCILPLVQ